MLHSPGEKLGPYELLSLLGEGGMGEVYKALDSRLNRTVALKISKEQFSERFEREARAVAALNHPHICTLYDVGPNYLVMEYLEGAPLKGPLPIAQAVEYAGQILEALDAAHRKGITHRDLKPANILLTRQGIKLLDFGLAKQAAALPQDGATATMGLTSQGQILGTLQYMSPEQLQGKEADARSDLFSFGCVLYEMLTGSRALEGDSAAGVIAAILEREPPPLTVAPALERIVRRALAKDPDQRFQTARDLKAALIWAGEQAPPTPAIKPDRRWQWIAAAAVAFGALGGWLLRQPPGDAPVFRLQINPPEGGQFAFGSGIGGIALSPDGRNAAYVASVSGKSGLWVRPLGGSAERLIPGTEGAGHPFWSPDGKSIAFFTSTKLLRVELAGGMPLPLCTTLLARGGAWTGDGRILFANITSGVFQVAASGGAPSPLTTLDASRGEGSHRWPQMLPGGRFLYLVQSARPENGGIFAASLAKPQERVPLLRSVANAIFAPGAGGKGHLLWLRGSTLVAQSFDPDTLKLAGEPRAVADPVAWSGFLRQINVSGGAGGVLLYSPANLSSQLTWFDRSGKPQGVVGEPANCGTFTVSHDGRRVAASLEGQEGADLWLLDTARGVASRFTPNSQANIYPVWSPDDRTILFGAGAPRNLFRKESSSAGTAEPVVPSPNSQLPTDWSRDGRWILLFETSTVGQRLKVLAVAPDGRPAPGAVPKPYLQTGEFNAWHGRFSLESPPRWVAYQADDTGRYEIYVQAFPEPRGRFQISTSGGQYPQWGAGGRELFYVSPDSKLMAVNLKFTADTVEPAAPRELFPLPAIDSGWSPYQASADGQRFLVRATPGKAGEPLTVIVNWPGLLKKGAPEP